VLQGSSCNFCERYNAHFGQFTSNIILCCCTIIDCKSGTEQAFPELRNHGASAPPLRRDARERAAQRQRMQLRTGDQWHCAHSGLLRVDDGWNRKASTSLQNSATIRITTLSENTTGRMTRTTHPSREACISQTPNDDTFPPSLRSVRLASFRGLLTSSRAPPLLAGGATRPTPPAPSRPRSGATSTTRAMTRPSPPPLLLRPP
jgi:hypothetical protein